MSSRSRVAATAWSALSLVLLVSTAGSEPALADLEPESPGRIERLPDSLSPHWIWVTDLTLERVALVDLDSGRFLGMVNSGYGPALALFPKSRREMYLPATYFSRRFRGERTDALEVWDLETLSFQHEILLPAHRAIDSFALAHAALSDDDRFAAVLNWTPATSLSIVDVAERRFAELIPIPGCTLAYAAGPRRFVSLCGDGAALAVTLDDRGGAAKLERTAPFFDPAIDPIMEKAVRWGDRWVFVSFAGNVHTIDVSGDTLAFPEPWPLFEDADLNDDWRVGGLQPLAVHERSGRLFVLVHQGGADEHKEPGTEVWVYDLESHRRVQRIPLYHPGVTILGEPIVIGEDWFPPFDHLYTWLLNTFAPPMVTHIVVTPDEDPLLATVASFFGSVGVYDADSGEMVRRLPSVGWTSETLYAPFGRP